MPNYSDCPGMLSESADLSAIVLSLCGSFVAVYAVAAPSWDFADDWVIFITQSGSNYLGHNYQVSSSSFGPALRFDDLLADNLEAFPTTYNNIGGS